MAVIPSSFTYIVITKLFKALCIFFFQIKKLRVGEGTSPMHLPLSLVNGNAGIWARVCVRLPNQCSLSDIYSHLSACCALMSDPYPLALLWLTNYKNLPLIWGGLLPARLVMLIERTKEKPVFHFEHHLSIGEISTESRWLWSFFPASAQLRTWSCKQLTLVECYVSSTLWSSFLSTVLFSPNNCPPFTMTPFTHTKMLKDLL